MGLFDLGWVLRFVNVVGCGLVVAMVDVGLVPVVAVGVVPVVAVGVVTGGGRRCLCRQLPLVMMMMIVIGIRRREYIILMCNKYYFNI